MKQAARVAATAPVGDTKPLKSTKGKKKGRRVWHRVPGDILCKILERLAPDMKSNYRSRLVCKHWNSSWQHHNWAPLWRKQGPWLRVYCGHGAGIEHHEIHEVWSLQNTSLFRTHPLSYMFTTSSQGLLVGVCPGDFLVIYNPLLEKRGVRPQTLSYKIRMSERLRVLLHVEDAARGIYKVGVVNTDSTQVYDSVTGGWEEFKTPHEFRSQADIFRACLLASRAAAAAGVGHRNPFTSPGTYMMQYHTDRNELEAEEQQQPQPAWIANSRKDVPRGFPSDVPHPFGMFLVNAAPGRFVALVLKTHCSGDERFMEVFVYELVETEAGDSVCWRRLGATRLLEGASPCVLRETDGMDCFCAENILVLQLPIVRFDQISDKATLGVCEKIQPLMFNLDDCSWTTLNLDSAKYSDRLVSYIFKPNPLARTRFLGEKLNSSR